MPDEFGGVEVDEPTQDDFGGVAVADESPVSNVVLNPYEQLRMRELGGGITATSGPPNPQEVLALPELIKAPAAAAEHLGTGLIRSFRDIVNPVTYLPEEEQRKLRPFKITPQGIDFQTAAEAEPIQPGKSMFEFRRTQLQPTPNPLQKLVESSTTPGAAVTLPVAGTTGGSLFFGLQGVQGATESLKVLNDPKSTEDEKREALESLPLYGAMITGAARHAMPKPAPPIQGPVAEGSILSTPQGAPAPRIEPAPVPETVSPQQAAAQAAAMNAEATAGFEPQRLPTPRPGEPPVVPEGPSDPRVGQAREAEADTIPKVLELFPEMKGNRESARIILKQAFPEGAKALSPADIKPALVVNGEPITGGETHAQIRNRAIAESNTPEELDAILKADKDPANRVFVRVDENGNQVGEPLTREQAATAIGEKGDLQSERLRELKNAEVPPKPLVQAEPPIATVPPEVPPPTIRGPATTADILGKVVSSLDAQADAARARLAAARGGTKFNLGPLGELPNIRDFAIIGAAKIARGTAEFARWSTEMVKDFGDKIKPHLETIFREAQGAFDQHTQVVGRVNRILYEAGLPRRSVAEAGKKAVGQAIEAGAEAGQKFGAADAAAKLATLQQQLSESMPNAVALREYFGGMERGSIAGRREALAEAKLADKWLEADADRIRQSLTEFAQASLPVAERGRFLKAIADATKRPALIGGDPAVMYRRAAGVAARIEERAGEVRKAAVATEIKEAVTKAIASPGVDIGYKKKILDAIKRITFTKPLETTVENLKATREYIARQEAAGKDVEMPKAVLDELEILGKVPVKELPEGVLEAIRDRVQSLEQLGRLKVKARKQVWEIEKNNKLQQLADEKTNPISERPEFRQQPGDPRPLSLKIRNWVNRQLNMGSLLDKALLPIDALFDLLGDAKGAYRGWLFKNVRNPLDLGFNEAQVLRDQKTAPVEAIVRKNKLGERDAERIGVYAASLQDGGVERMVEMGVKPETIDSILKTISPAEMEAYQAMRKAMDSTLPDIQKLMHELYNIDIKPVDNYFPMPRDWNAFEPEPKAPAGPAYGSEMNFDELAGWKQMLGDFTQPKTTATERGFTLERQKGAVTPIKLNAFDVFHQHMNDVAYLLKTQRDLKMIGEMARTDAFAQKYGKMGQNIVLSWLDTVARQGRIGGFRRIPMLDELRRRTSAGVIGFRLASQFVHLSNIPLSVWRTGGPGWWKAGLGEALGEKGQKFLKDNFAETYARGGGEPALVEAAQSEVSAFGKTVIPKSVIQASFAIARKIDQYNAQATTLGIYLRLLAQKGLDPRRYAELPVDKQAQAEALVLSRRAVASPLPKDVSASLARGAITGGNISLGRTIFQFQNIFQDQWSNIRHDLAVAGIREKNPKLAATAFVALSAMLLAEMGIREASKEAIASATGFKSKKEQSPEERIAIEAARRIPFGGQLTSQVMYGETGVPLIDSFVDTAKALKTAATAKKDATRTKGAIRATAGAAQLMGVPGASQMGELIEKSQ